MRWLLWFFLLALLPVRGNGLTVLVSVAPQLEAVRRIGAGLVAVEPLVPASMNPENYVVPPQRVARLGQASVWFLIGLPIEGALVRKVEASLPGLRLVDTRAGMRLQDMDQHAHEDCAGGHGHDPHVWLSLDNMVAHARTVGTVLAELRPDAAGEIRQRTAAYVAELEQLKEELAALLAPCRGRPVLVVHPAFGYFLSAHGLPQMAVEEGGKEPGAKYLAGLIRQITAQRLRTIFTQPQFSGKTATALASRLGLQVVVLDPLPDPYQAGMRRLAGDLRIHLRQE